MKDSELLIAKGKKARILMGDPFFKEVITVAKDGIFSSIENSDPSDTSKREEYFYLLKALSRIQQVLTDFASSGSIEENGIRKEDIITLIR